MLSLCKCGNFISHRTFSSSPQMPKLLPLLYYCYLPPHCFPNLPSFPHFHALGQGSEESALARLMWVLLSDLGQAAYPFNFFFHLTYKSEI